MCGAMFEMLKFMGADDMQIIMVSVTDSVKHADASRISVHAIDTDELEENFYIPSLPAAYVVTGEGFVLHKNNSFAYQRCFD